MSEYIPFAVITNNNNDNNIESIPTINIISYGRRIDNLPSGALYLPPPPPTIRNPSRARHNPSQPSIDNDNTCSIQ